MSAIRNMLLASLAAALVIAPRAASASTTQSRNYVTNAMAAWLAPGHVNDYGAWTFTGESEPTDATENGVTTVSYEFDAGDTLRYAPAAPSPEGLPASVSVTGAVFQAGFVDPDVSVVAGRQAALAVLQREGDDAPAFYAWTGGMEVTDGGATTNLFWTKLAGVSFVAGNAYDVELDFDYAADPATVSFTVGGNALSDAATGTTNAFPLATAENKVNAVGFSGAGSFTGLGGDYDVTFYDVRFYDGAVEYAGYAQTVEAGGLATAPSPDPEKNGFAFAAWTNGLSAVYDFATPVNADLALGAQWTASAVTLTVPAVANATVSATTNGVALAGEAGAGGATVYTVEPGTPVAVTYTAAAGYHVTGSPNDVTTRLYEVSAADTASDYVLDASATTMSLNVYTVTFTWHGGSDAATYDHGTLAADIAVPRDPPDYVEGGNIYSFTGWSAEVPETITADLTFTAQYSATAAAASVFTVTDNGDGTATTNDVAYYATLADAVANAGDGATVLLLDDVTLTARLEPNAGADTAITIDLGGNKITRTGTSGNGSAFDVKSGDVTIRNGTIDCTQDDTAIAEDGVYAITSRSGSNVTLADLAITVDSECGACAYPFSGSTMTIESGTYANVTTTPYRYNTAITGMAVNQPNEATQSLVIKGGSFSQYDPQLGDDSGKMTDFTDEGFVAIQDGNGNWVVQPGYNVTFDANGGSPAPAAQRVAVGGTATAPTAPTAANRDFLGWFASGATAAYDFTAEVVADLVLTAAWDASYTASFDKDAYTATGGGVMSMKVTIIRADGETLTTADKDGWTLEYDSPRLESSGTPVWSLSKGTVTYKAKRNDAGFDTATGTVNLKRGDRVYDTATISVAPSATWTFTPSIANGAKRMVESGPVTVSSVKVNGIAVDLADYTVTSDDDSLATVVQDGSSATVTPVAAGKAAFTLADGNGGTLPLSVTFVDAVAKIGMTFYDSVSAAVKAVADGETIQLVANTTESQVSVSKDCAFTIDLAGKVWTATAGSYSALKMSKGLVTLEDSSEDGTGVVQGSGELDGAHYGISFDQVANDAAVNKLVVRGGTVQGVSHAVIIGNKVDSTKKFFGGSLEVYGGKFIATLDTADTLDPNGHVRATINYLDVPSGYTVYGAPSATIYGGSFYNFDPADNVAEGAGTSFLPATGYVSVADDPSSGWFTVYEAVTVTFVNDKGAAPEAQVIGKGKTATEPADPAAVAGFRFDGWFAEGAEEAFDFDTAIAADLTLTAKWTPTTATVIWVVEGTQTEETYDIGATPVYPGATPTKAGTDSSVYVFTGWSPALGEVTAAGATYTAQFSLVSLSPASLELYPNCSNYVQVVGAPAGSTYTYKFAGQVGADSYLANPPGWSKTEGWAWPYGKQPGGTGTITVTVTNDNAQIAVLTANVTVKDVAAVVDGVEYASAQFGDALNAAKTGDKVLEVYYYASGYAKVALGADESIRWKPADNRGKASFWTSAVTVPATTDTDWYKAIASKDAATGVTTVTCESQGAPYVKIDDGTTVTYSTSSFPTMSTAGATYTMLRDITRTSAIVTSASGVVLDLNGYTLTLTKGSMNVKGGLTVKDDSEAGTGTIAKTTATGTDTKLFLVNGGGTVAITGGAYESAGEILYTDETAGSAATISGGTFSSTAADTAFLLNCSDDNKGAIAVTGGSFQGFDPANNAADGADTDYVATGYVSVADDPSSGWYTVYEAVTVTFADDKVAPPEAQVIGKGKTANEPEAPTFTGWTFEGWYTNLVAGEAWDFDDPVVEDITLTAKWTQNEYDVIWVADGAQFASNRVAHGTAMPVPAENPTKSGDDNALYTFVAWTPAQDATVSSNATYTAQFKTWTKVVAPTAAEGLVYDGTEQTGVEAGQGYTLSGDAVGTDAGDYTATASLADAENTVWADATEVNAAATAAKTIDWSIAKAPLSALAVSLQGWTEGKTANTPVVSGNVGGGAETITYWSQDGETQLSGQPTAAGTYTVKVSVPETANYQAGSATASFTIDEIGTYTIIWIAADGSEIDRTTVEEGQMPTHDDPTIADASGGKYAYTFTGWSPALVAATEGATYRATFKTNIAVKLALPLADHAVDATVNGAAATVALAPAGLLEGTEVAATPASAIYAAGTLSFSDLAWNAGTTWTADAAQGEVPLAEAAHNEGTFYAKASTPFFTAAPEQFEAFSDMGAAGVGYANDVASAEGEAVRIHTTIDVPAEGLTSEPEVGDAAAGFAVLQLSGDTAAAFYAYDGTTWTKLLGVTPAEAEGEADYLAVYDFAASPATVRYYIDGVPLYAEGQGGAKNYAIPLPAGMTSLSTIAFGSAEMVKSDVVAVQDVSYVAAVGDTPYTNATDVVTAVGTALASADAATVTLLADDVSGSIELAVGKSVTVVAGSYESGLAFTAADAPTYKVVEAAGDPATTVTYSVELNEATVIWLAENGTELYSTGIVIGTIPVYLGEAQTKAATDAALYTFEGWNDGVQTWTGDLPAVAVGGTNYTAAFKTWTKVDRPAVATGLVYSGEEQTGVTVAAGSAATGTTAATAAGDYSATVALDSADSVWSDATDPADAAARETVTAEWSIARKPVTVAAQAASKVAGNADPELTATVDGTVGSDTVSYTVTRVAGETAGEYEITASGDAEQGNYAVTFTGATFTITGAQVMIISVADAETGATATNYVATLADAVENVASGETIVLLADVGEAIVNTADKAFTIDLNGQTWSSPSDVLTTTAGTITIEATNGGTMTTEAAECCAVWAKGGDVVINGGTFLSKDTKEATIYVSNADSVVTINGGTFQNTAEGDYAYAAGNKVDKPLTLNVKNDLAGEAHIILNGGTFYGNDPMLGDDHIPVTDAAGQFVDPDYFAVSEGGAFTVVERIDIAGAVVTVADGLVYDATAKAGVDSVDYGTTNLVAGTDYVVTYANNVNAGEDTAVATIVGTNLWTGTITTNFSIAKAAATITVTAASKTYGADDPEFAGTVEGLVNEGDLGTVAYSRTGSDENVGTYDDVLTATYTANDNYTVTVVPADFTINAKTLTIVAEAKTQVYGAEAVALTYTSEGLEEGDEITGALTRAEGDDVGTYAISQGTLTAGDNYTIAFTGANYTITKAPVTITVANASKTYGDADPTFTGTVEGLVNAGDLGTIVYSRLNSDEDVGTYEAMLDAEYEANANYEVTLVRGDFTINAKAVTVTVAAKTKEYGDADPELTYEVAGLVNGDTLTGALTRAEGENVGSYAITQGTLAAGGNYTIAFTGANLTITKATATVTAEAKSKTYGDADPELTATVTGLKGEETAAVISYTLSRAEGENAGTYAITPAGDAEQGNYDVVYVPANLTIGAKTLTITVAAKTKEYGDAEPELTYETDGLEDGDSLTGALTRAEGENVGTYAITQGTLAAGDNYTITFTGADLTITKATATVTAEAKSKTYGDADPELTATVTGLKGEDTAAVISYTLSRAEGENAGTYAITPAGDAEQGNYDVVYVPANLTIGAKTLTITVAAKTKEYGDADPELTYEADGLEDGDELTGALTRAEGENVGTYAITQGTLAAGDNYTIAFTGADLTITKATATVTAEAKSKTYGDADPELTATVTGLKGEDTAAVISYTLSRAEGENAGTYAITPAGDAEQGNYDVVYVPANLTIGAKTLTIVAEAKTQVYGAEAVALTYTSEGLEEGDEITGALTRAEGDDVGTYAISQGTLAAGDNYTIAFTGADYTITAAIVDIPAAPGNKTYNGAVQTADVASADTYTVTNEGGTNAGDYTVVFALKDTANYTWSDGSTTNQTFGWQITAKPVTITVDNATKKHGETDPAFTGSVEGLVDAADLGTVAYGRTNATEEVGVYAGVIVPTYTANANYAVTVTPGTFTIESNKFTVIWLADDGTTVIDSTEVEWGEVPAHADATKTDATGKYAYAFAAWSPAPVAVTESTNYVATFTTSIATPLALPLADPELSSTVVNGSSATVTLDPAGTIDGVSFSASPETATWTAAAGTLAFTGLGWNEGVAWSVSAAQGEAELAETASNAGKFYVKPETSWFTATADDFEDLSDASDATVAYEAESASPEGEMVRVHTKIQVPAGGLPQTPATGSAKVGFAVLQLETDTAPAYYAFGNGAWTKLAGVAPAEGEHDYLAVYDLAADTPTARYYIDGVALYQAVDGGDDVYALPLAATTKSLSSISFASKDMVTDDVVAEYDVSYAAAVGDTPYVEIADALAAQDKDPAKTLALLKKGVGLDAPVSLGAKSEAFVVDYAKGSFTNDTPAVSGLAGYDVAATAGEGAVTNYALAAIVYPIEYVLNGGANAAANTNEYTVETLPVALAAATREGYTFAGWTNNVSADQRVTSIPADTLGAVTNVASWTINDYLLTVNYLYATGGVAATAFTSNVVYDTAYSVDSPAVTGYTADRTVVSGTMGAAPVTVDVTYTVNRYKVKFVDEDGETVLKAETEYDYGTLAADVEKPADPTKAATADKVYTFAGWSPAVADVTGDATYTATYSETGTAAAVITVVDNGDGTATTNTAYVATLAEAIEAAQDGDTVQLLADVSEPAVAIEDDITIDLNGNTWTVTAADGEDAPGSIVVSGDVAIVDSSEDGDGAISSAAATVLVVDAGDEAGADASVTIGEDATITATGDNATALAVVDGSATVEGAVTGDVTVAEDGDVTVGGGTVAGDIASTGGIVEVADGTVDGDVTATGDGATVAVIGGDVTGGVAVSNGADATVSAGSVADGIAATGEGSTVAVSGGTVSGGIEGDDDIAVSGGAVNGCVDAGGKLTITGGTITAAVGADEPAISAGGATEISGGTVNGDVEAVTGGDVKISGTADIEGNVEANGEGSTVGISGGTVSGTLSETNGGDITVTGGHFAEDPTTYVDTDAYQVSGNATDGYDVTERTSIEGAVISVAENLIYTGLGQPGVTNVAVDGTALVLGTDYTVAYDDNVNAGTVTATISGAGAWNGSTNVTFQIGKATLVATADDKTVDYGTDPAEIVWTVTVTGFVNNETTNDLVSVPVAACATYTDRTLPGEYAIVASGGEAANYVITYADGVLAVAATAQPVKPGDLFTAADIAAGVKPVEVTDDGKFVVRFRRAQTGVTYELVAATSLETTEAQWKGVAESGNAVVLATDTTTTEVGDLVEFEVETPAAYPVRFFKIRASFKTNEQP